MRLEPIGHIESPYKTKFGVPRQPGLAPAVTSRLVFDVPAKEIISLTAGQWAHVIWSFSHNLKDHGQWSKTVRPPILGGTERAGVFATRSSFRPNSIALSTVQVSKVMEEYLEFIGGDMVDGTPVFGLLPYVIELDARPDALSGWPRSRTWPLIESVIIPDEFSSLIQAKDKDGIIQVLSQDPRPAYTRTGQEGRMFWTAFGDYAIWFVVEDGALIVKNIELMDLTTQDHLIKTGNLPNNITNHNV